MTAQGFTAATVYVPDEGAMLVAQKGTGQLLPEGSESALARDAVDYQYPGAEFRLLKAAQGA